MTPPKFAVVGTGHSGTGYVAALLNRNGLTVGHEKWWSNGFGHQINRLDGDVSWLALPEIEAGTWSGPVAHVVRHPYGCVRSLSLFFSPPHAKKPFIRFARENQELPEDQVEAAVEWWVEWNARCAEVSRATIRLEDLTTQEGCDALGKAIGHPVEPHPVISKTTNKHPSQDVPDWKIKKLLNGRAERYGYSI